MAPRIAAADRQRSFWLLVVAYPTLFTWVYFVALQHQSTSLQQLAYTLGKCLQFGFPILWVWCFAQPPWPPLRAARSRAEAPTNPEALSNPATPSGDGRLARTLAATTSAAGSSELPALSRLTGIGLGVAFGLSVAVATVALFYLLPEDAEWFVQARAMIRAKVVGLGVNSSGRFLLLGLFYAIGHSAAEEYYWRWFVFRGLTKVVQRPAALLISSLGFMAHHVILLGTFCGFAHPATWCGSLAVAVGGYVWALLYDRSGRLLGPWLSHLLVDAGLFSVGYLIAREAFG
ncbi:MAG: CPBP family intramembrane glutamic endopeptidase [Planctomycetota bacterium]